MEAKDFALNDDGDLIINSSGDFDIKPSDQQHIKDIINSNIGWYKQYPLIGVGIDFYIKSGGQKQTIERAIKLQLRSDGYTVDRPIITEDPNGKLTINPNAVRL